MSASKKRGRTMFDAVSQLETQDAAADKLRRTASQKDVQRSKAAQSQTKVYSCMVECRILLQRSMTTLSTTTVAALPGEDKPKTTLAVELCNNLLEQLLQARYKITNPVSTDGSVVPNYKKLLLHNDAQALAQRLDHEYAECRDEWKNVLNSRHQSVRMHTGLAKNSKKTFLKVLDSSFWEQVESTVQHEELLQRSAAAAGNQNESAVLLFDDAKVYQQLLKDFVTDSRQDTAQQRLQQKGSRLKITVDRRASKGRKIRYAEITKLANFTFPVSRSAQAATSLDEDGWFRSLFGGAGVIKAQSID
jgi:hypothetical protein